MSQQYQPVGQGVQQAQGGVQSRGSQMGQQQGFQPVHFDEALPSEYRATLDDLSWLRKQTKWASKQAHRKLQGTGVETTLEDISEIAELNEELILANSKYVEYQIDTFRKVATEAIQQLQQYQQEPFVEAVVSDLSRAIHSAEELLAKQGGIQQVGTQQSGTPQSGASQSGLQQGQQSQVPGGSQSQAPPQSQPQTQTQQPFGQSQY